MLPPARVSTPCHRTNQTGEQLQPRPPVCQWPSKSHLFRMMNESPGRPVDSTYVAVSEEGVTSNTSVPPEFRP